MNQEIITNDGEIIGEESISATSSMAVQLQKAEIDQLVTTAHAYPRSLKRVQSNILSMATLDEESAEECIYALPRGGKPIRGPSIRFAEILKQSYGNCRAAARVVHVDKTEGFIEAEGVFHDLETNAASTSRVRRRITDRYGRVLKDDMIIVTGNAACSIAMRNAILAGVPKPLWRKAYDMVQATITGDITTLSENREKAFKALAAFGVKPEQVFTSLGIQGEEDITVDHIATLRGMYSALKNGEATVEEMFIGTVKAVSDHAVIENPFSAEPKTAEVKEPTSETETLASSAENQEQTASDVEASSTSDSEGEDSSVNSSTLNNPDEEATLSTDDREVLKQFIVSCAAASAPTEGYDLDPAVIVNSAKGLNASGKLTNNLARTKAGNITRSFKSVCEGKADLDAAISYSCEEIGIDPDEVTQ